MPAPVANPLTLVMDIKSKADFDELQAILADLQSRPPKGNPITTALDDLSMVHFARFVFLGERQLAVITTYDGEFDRYIEAFADKIGSVFDLLLSHVEDAPPLPVSQHPREFLDYVRRHDIPCVGTLYSAYPQLKVLDILTLEQNRRDGIPS